MCLYFTYRQYYYCFHSGYDIRFCSECWIDTEKKCPYCKTTQKLAGASKKKISESSSSELESDADANHYTKIYEIGSDEEGGEMKITQTYSNTYHMIADSFADSSSDYTDIEEKNFVNLFKGLEQEPHSSTPAAVKSEERSRGTSDSEIPEVEVKISSPISITIPPPPPPLPRRLAPSGPALATVRSMEIREDRDLQEAPVTNTKNALSYQRARPKKKSVTSRSTAKPSNHVNVPVVTSSDSRGDLIDLSVRDHRTNSETGKPPTLVIITSPPSPPPPQKNQDLLLNEANEAWTKTTDPIYSVPDVKTKSLSALHTSYTLPPPPPPPRNSEQAASLDQNNFRAPSTTTSSQLFDMTNLVTTLPAVPPRPIRTDTLPSDRSSITSAATDHSVSERSSTVVPSESLRGPLADWSPPPPLRPSNQPSSTAQIPSVPPPRPDLVAQPGPPCNSPVKPPVPPSREQSLKRAISPPSSHSKRRSTVATKEISNLPSSPPDDNIRIVEDASDSQMASGPQFVANVPGRPGSSVTPKETVPLPPPSPRPLHSPRPWSCVEAGNPTVEDSDAVTALSGATSQTTFLTIEEEISEKEKNISHNDDYMFDESSDDSDSARSLGALTDALHARYGTS